MGGWNVKTNPKQMGKGKKKTIRYQNEIIPMKRTVYRALEFFALL